MSPENSTTEIIQNNVEPRAKHARLIEEASRIAVENLTVENSTVNYG